MSELESVVCPKFEVNPNDADREKGVRYKSVYANCMHCKYMTFGDCRLEFYEFGEKE